MITEKNLEYEGTRTFWQNSLLSKAIVLPTLKQESSIEKNDGLKYISESLLTMKQTLKTYYIIQKEMEILLKVFINAVIIKDHYYF